jgi:hypothetical protein
MVSLSTLLEVDRLQLVRTMPSSCGTEVSHASVGCRAARQPTLYVSRHSRLARGLLIPRWPHSVTCWSGGGYEERHSRHWNVPEAAWVTFRRRRTTSDAKHRVLEPSFHLQVLVPESRHLTQLRRLFHQQLEDSLRTTISRAGQALLILRRA